MLTLGFDSYIEPLRTFLTKVRDASKYDRTITMGGELSDDLRVQVAQAQSNQSSGPMVQAQVATKIQVQPQATGTSSVPLPGPTIAAKPTATPNGLEPYGHSVSRRVFERISLIVVAVVRRFVWSLVFEMINRERIPITSIPFNRINN